MDALSTALEARHLLFEQPNARCCGVCRITHLNPPMSMPCSNTSDGAQALPCPNSPSCYAGGLSPPSGRADLLGGHPGAQGKEGGRRVATGPAAPLPLTSRCPRWKRAAERLAKQTDTSGLPGSSWDAACGDQREPPPQGEGGDTPQRGPLRVTAPSPGDPLTPGPPGPFTVRPRAVRGRSPGLPPPPPTCE